ncbi:hypothetical protein [Candidatus Borrarchaeum sp.]|uniref:hypothetical protein n=1 Tax=Candidatus Borrarchaeum sp. TaxID=2846742 RepID=UPI00257D811C|nr:hypothetical protein [Candidatus Borrarchaeum sp.]
MDKLFKVLDFVTSALVIVTLYLIPRSHKWWLAYAANSLLFSAVTAHNKVPGLTLMGFCLCGTAIKNYIVEGRKKRNESKNSIS